VKPVDVIFALLGFMAFVAVVPAWMWFTTQHSGIASMSTEARFLVQAALPFSVLLFLGGWFQPGGG